MEKFRDAEKNNNIDNRKVLMIVSEEDAGHNEILHMIHLNIQ
jgi:hypothetical protein